MNLVNLILYSGLAEFWEIFETIVSLSPLDSNGFLTLTMAEAYLKEYPKLIQLTHYEFWEAMSYCLARYNKRMAIERKQKQKALEAKRGR